MNHSVLHGQTTIIYFFHVGESHPIAKENISQVVWSWETILIARLSKQFYIIIQMPFTELHGTTKTAKPIRLHTKIKMQI